MTIDELKQQLPESAKDIKLNLSMILTEEGSPDLSLQHIAGILLSVAIATKHRLLIDAVKEHVREILAEAEMNAAESAAIIMAMNNVYYRFTHLVSDASFSAMPAKLRMNVMMNPGVDKISFELYSLAVSALNGCGMCMDAHTKTLIKEGVSKAAIQSSVRIAAVLNAVTAAV